MSMNHIGECDDAILAWKNTPVYNVTIEVESEVEPQFLTHSEEFQENLSHINLLHLS